MDLVLLNGRHEKAFQKFLSSRDLKDIQIIALDENTASFLDSQELQYQFLEDYFTVDEMNSVFERAYDLEIFYKSTILADERDFIKELHSQDQANLSWLWLEAATCEQLVPKILQRKFKNVHVFGNLLFKPVCHYLPSDSGNSILARLLKNKVKLKVHKSYPSLNGLALNFLSISRLAFNLVAVNKISQFKKSKVTNSSKDAPLDILAFFNQFELPRYADFLNNIQEEHSVQVISISTTQHKIFENIMFSFTKSISFSRKWSVAMVMSGDRREIFESLKPTVSYIFTKRIPRFHKKAQRLRQHLEELKPSLVLVSSLTDLDSFLPALIAKELGIKTVTVPHSHISRVNDSGIVDYTFLQYPFQLVPLKWAKVHHNLVKSKGILATDFYNKVKFGLNKPEPFYLLIGFDEVLYQGAVSIGSNRLVRNAVEEISKAVSRNGSKLNLIYKPHPLESENSAFLNFVRENGMSVADPSIGLNEYLVNADVVIIFGSIQSSFFNSLRLKKPTFFVNIDTNKFYLERLRVRELTEVYLSHFNIQYLEVSHLAKLIEMCSPLELSELNDLANLDFLTSQLEEFSDSPLDQFRNLLGKSY